MAIFLWHAKTRQGQEKSGDIDVANRDVALATLRRQGLVDIKVKKKPVEIEIFPEKVNDKDISVFFRQLSTMINAGLPLVQCFELAEKGSEKKSMVKLLKEVRQSLEGGSPLGETMRKFPKEFDRLTCSLVEAGEQGGILDTILLRLCIYKEKALSLKGKIKSAMVYPVAIIVVAFIVTAILMIFVIPVFAEMFADFGGSLPVPTQIVINISNFVQDYILVIIGVIVVAIFTFKKVYATKKGRERIDDLALKLPVFGILIRKVAVAKFTRTLGTMISSGVPILDGLEIVAKTAGNKTVEKAIYRVRQSISEGKTIAEPLEKSGVFPPMVCQMIAVGEQSGAIDTMLNKIADFYDDEVDDAVSNLTAMMEPLLMLFLGTTVGGLVIAMYLPIFKLAGTVAG